MSIKSHPQHAKAHRNNSKLKTSKDFINFNNMFFGNKKNESHEFISQLTADIHSLERLIHEDLLEDYDRIGAEQEFCLVDENYRANPINQKILQKIQKHGFVAEIAKFNMNSSWLKSLVSIRSNTAQYLSI